MTRGEIDAAKLESERAAGRVRLMKLSARFAPATAAAPRFPYAHRTLDKAPRL